MPRAGNEFSCLNGDITALDLKEPRTGSSWLSFTGCPQHVDTTKDRTDPVIAISANMSKKSFEIIPAKCLDAFGRAIEVANKGCRPINA